jgi:hypothetical protein
MRVSSPSCTDATRRRFSGRNSWRILAATVLALGVMFPVRAEFVSNAQVDEWLAEATKRGGSFKDVTLALGFVSGIHDLHAGSEICTPDGVRARDLLPVIREWMKANQPLWGQSGAKTVRRALADLYPCPSSGNGVSGR